MNQNPEIQAISPAQHGLPFLLISQALSYLAAGTILCAIQIIAANLNLNPSQIGIVHAALLAPIALASIPALNIAQYNNNRSHLIQLQFAAALPIALLAAMTLTQNINFNSLIIFALITGTITTFIIHAQHSLTTLITPTPQMAHTSKITSQIKCAAAITGMLIIGLAQTFISWAILAQSFLLCLAALAVQRMPHHNNTTQQLHGQHPHGQHPHGQHITEKPISEGLRNAFADKHIAPALILIICFSALSIGPTLTFLPLIIRDHYDASALDLALVNIILWGTTITLAAALAQQHNISYNGLALVCAATTPLIALLLLSIPGPIGWLYITTSLWGAANGAFLAVSKNIIQRKAQDILHNRLLAIYQILIAAGAALGTLAFGAIAELTPAIHIAPLIPMFSMLIIIASISSLSSILYAKFTHDT